MGVLARRTSLGTGRRRRRERLLRMTDTGLSFFFLLLRSCCLGKAVMHFFFEFELLDASGVGRARPPGLEFRADRRDRIPTARPISSIEALGITHYHASYIYRLIVRPRHSETQSVERYKDSARREVKRRTTYTQGSASPVHSIPHSPHFPSTCSHLSSTQLSSFRPPRPRHGRTIPGRRGALRKSPPLPR